MKKIQLIKVLDHYDERASWTFLHGFFPSKEMIELHDICDKSLSRLKDNDEIPQETVNQINTIASHADEQWTEIASDALHEIENIIHPSNSSRP